MITGWQKVAIASWAMSGLLLLMMTYHHRETVLIKSKPVFDQLTYYTGVQLLPDQQSPQEQISARLATSTKWEDIMTKWFPDIGTKVNKTRTRCDRLLPANRSFGGEYNSRMAEFEAAFKKSTVKGGVEGFSSQVPAQAWVYHVMARKQHVQTVCETGFNAGHSTYMWLTAHPASRVMSFDLGNHAYAHKMAEYLNNVYPGRLTVTFGDSTKTLPAFNERIKVSEPGFKCDIIIVDGGHTYPVAKADMENFRSLAIPGHTIVVLDDYPSTMFPFGAIGKVWEDMKKDKVIAELFGCTMGNRGFILGYFL